MWCRIWNTRFDPALRRRSPRRVSTEKGRSYGWCRLITPLFALCCMHDNAGRASCSTGAKFWKSLFAVFLIVASPSGIIDFVIASWFLALTAARSLAAIFFCARAPHAPIFFSRSSLGSLTVFFLSLSSRAFPFICSFVFRVFCPAGFCLAAVDFGSTVLPV